MLTLNGYRIDKPADAEALRKELTVKPMVPKVFVSNPNAVPRYRVYKETADALYLPKHYGIAKYGPPTGTTREVPSTHESQCRYSSWSMTFALTMDSSRRLSSARFAASDSAKGLPENRGCTAETNATCCPSGDHTPCVAPVATRVTGRASPPANARV